MDTLEEYKKLVKEYSYKINIFVEKEDNRSFFYPYNPKYSRNIEYVVFQKDVKENKCKLFYMATKPNAKIMGTEATFLYNDTELILPIIIRGPESSFIIEYYKISIFNNDILFELIKDTKIFS